MTKKKSWGPAVACLITLANMLMADHAQAAEDWPSQPIRMLVAFPPGGGTDTLARLIGDKLGTELGQSVIVVNRGGAGGSVGTQAAARAEPNGYNILLGTSNITLTQAIDKIPPFTLDDFVPITLLTQSPFVLVATRGLGVATVAELTDYTKKHKDNVVYASTGVGALQHLTTESFKLREGLDWLHVPYQGGGPALAALLAGQAQVMFSNMVPALPHIENSRLVPLAQTTKKRSSVLPNVPTMEQAGIKDFVVSFWSGVLAPKGTPDAIVRKLNTALANVMALSAIQTKLTSQGMIVDPLGPKDFADYLQEDITYWKDVATKAKFEVN